MTIHLENIPANMKADLIGGAEYSEETINGWTPRECLDAWLTWHGIIGYTSSIVRAVSAIENASSTPVGEW